MKLRTFSLVASLVPAAVASIVYATAPVSMNEAHAEPTLPPERDEAADEPEAKKDPSDVPAGRHALASPSTALTAEARLGHRKLVGDGDVTTFVMVEVHGSNEAQGTQTATQTAIVLDRSGSMAGERLTHAVRAARGFVSRAAPRDIVSITTFDDEAALLMAPRLVGEGFLSHAESRLAGIRAGGGTCISCGLDRGVLTLRPAANVDLSAGRVRRVVLLSDGAANHGVVDADGIDRLARRYRDQGVSVTTVGMGASYNEQILSALSRTTNGNHHFVGTPEDLPAVFEREAASLGRTVLANAEARIALAPGVELERLFDRAFRRQGDELIVPLGPMSAGDDRTVLLEVRLPSDRGDRPVAEVDVAFRLPDGPEQQTRARELSLTVEDRGRDGPIDSRVGMRIARARTVEAVDRATSLFKSGQALQASQELESRAAELRAVTPDLVSRAQSDREPFAEAIRIDLAQQLRDVEAARKQFKTLKPHDRTGRSAVRETRARFFPAGL